MLDNSLGHSAFFFGFQVSWAYIVFDNAMIQLLKVGHLIPQSTENVESNTPQNPLMSANPKIAFWVMDEVNLSEYIDDVKKQSTDMGFEKVCSNSVSDIMSLHYFT